MRLRSHILNVKWSYHGDSRHILQAVPTCSSTTTKQEQLGDFIFTPVEGCQPLSWISPCIQQRWSPLPPLMSPPPPLLPAMKLTVQYNVVMLASVPGRMSLLQSQLLYTDMSFKQPPYRHCHLNISSMHVFSTSSIRPWISVPINKLFYLEKKREKWH